MNQGSVFRSHRVFPYPPQTVSDAFARPELLARWWGPAGFSNTFEVFEFRPGGRWKFVMHGPDGTHHPNESVFVEIPVRLKPATRDSVRTENTAVSTLVIHHVSPPRYMLTITLAPNHRGTTITWVQEFEDPAVAARIRHIVEPANEQNLDRLLSVLTAEQSQPG